MIAEIHKIYKSLFTNYLLLLLYLSRKLYYRDEFFIYTFASSDLAHAFINNPHTPHSIF